MNSNSLQLVCPGEECLGGYSNALERGWFHDSFDAEEKGRKALARIQEDPQAYLASLVDREAKGSPIELPDGTLASRLPGYHRWLWDGEYCGTIGFRWQPGTSELPPHCLGHIGYFVVPWKQRKGYATEALRLLLPEVAKEGLTYVEITTEPENVPSKRVIQANGGVLIERFNRAEFYGGGETLKYRIYFYY